MRLSPDHSQLDVFIIIWHAGRSAKFQPSGEVRQHLVAAMSVFEPGVLWNQVVALASNIWIWFLRTVLRLPPPALIPAGVNLRSLLAVSEQHRCASIEIVGPGGVDQMRIRDDCWAVCGYNLMSEFGGQRISGPVGTLRSDLVVVRNKAFSINYADVCCRWGLYESALRFVGWPIVPGFDIAGVVENVGADSGFAVGDRVWGFSAFGGYSSRVIVPHWQIMHMPLNMSFESAAALPAAIVTALHATCLAGIWPEEPTGSHRDVLVHSAAGGVGDMLCQVLRLRGMRVIGVVGASTKVKACKADVVIDKSSEEWHVAAMRHAPQGFCAVFDANGVASLKISYDLLARNGRLVVYGFHSNLPKCDGGLGMLSPWTWLRMGVDLLRMPRFDPMKLTLDSKAVLGFNLSFFADEHELCSMYLTQVEDWVTEGKISAPNVRTFGLEGVRDAHAALQSGRTVGKMVVSM